MADQSLVARVYQNDQGEWAATECFEGELHCPALLDLSATDPSFITELQSAIVGASDVENETSLPLLITGTSAPDSRYPGVGTIKVSQATVTDDRPQPPISPESESYLNLVGECLKSKKTGLEWGAKITNALAKRLPSFATLRTLSTAAAEPSAIAVAGLAAFFGGLTVGAVIECFVAALPGGRLAPPPIVEAPEEVDSSLPAFSPWRAARPTSGGWESGEGWEEPRQPKWGRHEQRETLDGYAVAMPGAWVNVLLRGPRGDLPLVPSNALAARTLARYVNADLPIRVSGALVHGVMHVELVWPLTRS